MARQIKRGNKFSKSSKFSKEDKPKFKGKEKDNDKTNDLSGSNDFKWYSLNKELVEMAGRIPFGRPIGNRVLISTDEITNAGATRTKKTSTLPIPGIMTFYMIPSVGCSLNGVQSIDVASKSIYSFVRHANSGHSNYDSPDLMMYLLAAREIYAAAGYLLKVYGCINKYDPTNRYLPDAVLDSLKIDPTFARANIADIRYYCAQFFKKAASIYTPKNLPMFEKAFWMYTQLYQEDKTGKSGLYQYAPAGFHVFNPTKYTTGGCLEYKAWNGAADMTTFTTYFNALLDPIISDEDMGIMSGDIKKAFDNNIWSVGDFPYDFNIEIVNDSFVLQQMHNTRAYGGSGTPSSLDIVQDNVNNEILFFPCKEAASNYKSVVMDVRGYGHLVDIDSAVPSTEEVIEATQYINSVTNYADISSTRLTTFLGIVNKTYSNKCYVITNCGDFYCHMIATRNIGANGYLEKRCTGDFQSVTDTNQTAAAVYSFCCYYSTFTFAPFIAFDYETPLFGNLHNYTIVDSNVIDNLHDTTWLSLLAIPAQQHLK